jgi:flagellar assembly protein FliH
MRSLSNVIHPGQYTSIISDFSPSELTPAAPSPEVSQKAPPAAPPKAPPEPGRRAAREQWQREARQIIEEAFLKAKQIVDSAQQFSAEKMRETRETAAQEIAEAKKRGYTDGYAQGSEQGRKEGTQAGYRAGFEQGEKKAEADNRKTLEELSLMIEAVEKSKTKILQKFEDDLIDLSTAMAKAIVKQELHSDERTMRNIIVAAMEEYRHQEWVRIYVPEKTASVLLKVDGGIAAALSEISDNVKVVVAPKMADGACIIETPDQVIDAGIDSQLAKIRQAISQAVSNQPDGV